MSSVEAAAGPEASRDEWGLTRRDPDVCAQRCHPDGAGGDGTRLACALSALPIRGWTQPTESRARQARSDRARTLGAVVREGGAAPGRDPTPTPKRVRELAGLVSRAG